MRRVGFELNFQMFGEEKYKLSFRSDPFRQLLFVNLCLDLCIYM